MEKKDGVGHQGHNAGRRHRHWGVGGGERWSEAGRRWAVAGGRPGPFRRRRPGHGFAGSRCKVTNGRLGRSAGWSEFRRGLGYGRPVGLCPVHPRSANCKRARQKPNANQLECGPRYPRERAPRSALPRAPGGGDLACFAQVELAGAEVRQRINVEELVGAHPKLRKLRPADSVKIIKA